MEEISITKIATEALKPVSGVIDALIRPKLKRIENWAEEQDIKSHLGNTAIINSLLEEYLRRLLRRICGITTIVFPQQILPITSIYEPLKLQEEYRIGRKGKLRLTAKTLQPGLTYLVVDAAGMGKSTFAKHLVLEILKFTVKIPIFLELRRISDSETLLQKLSAEIDESNKHVDDKLLLMLLEQGNFVIILDGYDELTDRQRDAIGKQITELVVRSDKNSWIITSRPEVSLPDLPDSRLFTIVPLSKDQAASLVKRYDALAKIDIGRKLIKQFDLVSDQFLETPLLVVLLYRTYGFNQSIATRISSFYDEVFNALYKGHDLSKAGFARTKSSQLDSEDFRRLLRAFAFLLVMRQRVNIKSKTEGVAIIDEATRLTSIKPLSSSSFFDDLLLAVPLLIRDGTDFRFIHKSFVEYFAAEFLAFHSGSPQIVERIRDGHLNKSFVNTFGFLSEINPSLFRRSIVAPLAKTIIGDPISDIYIRSVHFWGEIFLGLWPSNKYIVKTTDEGEEMEDIELPDRESFGGIHFSYGSVNKDQYILAAAESRNMQALPYKAWELITSQSMAQLGARIQYDELDFSGLEKSLGIEQWIEVADERVQTIVDHVAVKLLLLRLLQALPKERTESPIRVLSEETFQDLLTQIQQEDETQSWLETLISNNGEQAPS